MTETKCLAESSGPESFVLSSCLSEATAGNFTIDASRDLQSMMSAEASLAHEHVDSGMLFDVSERCMVWPTCEINTDLECEQNIGLTLDEILISNDACLLFAMQQSAPCDRSIDMFSCLGSPDGTDSFDPFFFLSSFPDIPEVVPSCWPMLLPSEPKKRLPITLVLDLDETLVHSTFEYCEDADFTFQVNFGTETRTVYVRQRPHLHMFLEAVAGMFEIIVFTASESIYAEQLLDILDPDHRLIGGRAFRESCVFSEGGYTKDLTVLGRDLAKIAIVDNSPQVFQLQVNNGIPIQSWFGDPSDDALISLLPFLETLAVADDVRPIIAKKFSSQEC